LEGFDGVLDVVELDVLFCDFEGLCREVDCDEFGWETEALAFFGDCHGDASATGAHIGDAQGALRRVFFDPIDAFGDDVFGFVAWDKARIVDQEGQGEEFLFSDEVGDWFAFGASFDQISKDGFDGFGGIFVEGRVEVDALAVPRVREEDFGVESRGARSVFFQVVGGPLEHTEDGPSFGLFGSRVAHIDASLRVGVLACLP
jgi:hypothetical protein